jgi:hypothetical protein
MRKWNYLVVIFFSFIALVCNNKKESCSVRVFQFAGELYKSTGCLFENLEQGEWSFSSEKDGVIQKGIFEKGVRTGVWHYPTNQVDSLIEWKRFEKPNLNLVFNIPSLLELVEDSLEYVKFSNKDSVKLANIVLSVVNIDDLKVSADSFYKKGEEDINSRNWTFERKRNKIESSKYVYYLNEYVIHPEKNNNFKVLNAYRVMNDGKLLEISCRYSDATANSAKIVFFSIMSNSFYRSERFMNPFEEIKSIAED